MGLFSSKKKVYVGSTVYKMVDDGSDRANFIQETIAQVAISGNSNASYADAIQGGIKNGARAQQRAFFRWAKANFDVGMPRAAINYVEVIDDVAMAAQILTADFASDPSYTINVIESFVDNADEAYYAERWVYENRPELAGIGWAADVDPVTNDILIQYPPGTLYLGNPIVTDTFTEPSFDSSDMVIISYYTSTHTGTTTPVKTFIYRIGDGVTALDDYVVELDDGSASREFYPFIPLRIDNKSVFESGSPAVAQQELIEKAWKKALGNDIQDALTEIESNEDIGEIDYAYLVFGVCLNTSDIAEKAYIFEFFRKLAGKQTIPASAYGTYQATNDALGYHSQSMAEDQLLNSNAIQDPDNSGHILGVDTATSSTAPQVTNIHLKLPAATLGVVDMKITWSDIKEERITGLISNGAKVGDVIIKEGVLYNQTTVIPYQSGAYDSTNSVPSITIAKQINALEYVIVTIKGLQHKNLIYKGKSVEITGAEALADPDDSGFIIPLHEPTLKELGAIKATDVAREAYLLVFNSYQVVKKKWYQSGFFQFLLAVIVVVIVAVITVLTYGAGTPQAVAAGSGILGTAAAVGAALGFSGLLAIAVGAAANAIAAMIILQLVAAGATDLFGEKIGRIITAVVAVIMIMGTGPGGFDFGNISGNISSMAGLDKLAMMTNAATDIVGAIQEAQLEKIMEEMREVTDDYKEEMSHLEDLLKEMGFNSGILDPMMVTDYTDPTKMYSQMGEFFRAPSTFGESPEDFLTRTLLTGSDLIDISHAVVTDFVTATLTLP